MAKKIFAEIEFSFTFAVPKHGQGLFSSADARELQNIGSLAQLVQSIPL
jgi:hypothetical protein